MKLQIDTDNRELRIEDASGCRVMDLYSRESFEAVSHEWLKLGWNQKHVYTFTWLGRPIIQLPEDVLRLQEVIFRVKPDVIVETGIAHGGSLIFSASLCKAMDKGRVIGVDVEIRPHNRKAMEEHFLYPLITMIEGSSIDAEVVEQVKSLVQPGETVLVILDSCHTKAHVLQELHLYHTLVTPDSYIVATDGSMQWLTDVPRGDKDWSWDHPTAAAEEFVQAHPEFVCEQPEWLFNESELRKNITHWPGAYLRRLG